MLILKFG